MASPSDQPPDPLRDRLERAAAGLVYSSESDYPFAFFAVGGPASHGVATAAGVAALLPGYRVGDRVEERTLEQFLARHIERTDPADAAAQALRPRYERLRAELKATLAGVRVLRLIHADDRAVVHCFVVGRDGRGRLAGLATSAIET